MPVPVPRLNPPSILRRTLGPRAGHRLESFIVMKLVAEPGDTLVYPECAGCRSIFAVPVNHSRYQEHARGEILAQNAYPHLHPGDRELFISGLCRRCFAAATMPPHRRSLALGRVRASAAGLVHRFRRK